MATAKKSKLPMEHYNMSDLLRGQASKIITAISEKDTAGFVCAAPIRLINIRTSSFR